MEIHRLDERIRLLCSKATSAPESELDSILTELDAALGEHTEFVRRTTAGAVSPLSKDCSSSASTA
jgi:hypothetical protein